MQTHEDNAQSGLFLAIHCFGKSSISDMRFLKGKLVMVFLLTCFLCTKSP